MGSRSWYDIAWIYLIFLVGILMNFTRSSIYGLWIAFIFIFVWYAKRHQLTLLWRRSVKSSSAIIVSIVLIVGGAWNVSEYTLHKFDNLFSQEEILEGGSSAYRLLMMLHVIETTMADTKKMIIGNGWGQTYVYHDGEDVQAGGGDMVNVFGYSGLLGGAPRRRPQRETG